MALKFDKDAVSFFPTFFPKYFPTHIKYFINKKYCHKLIKDTSNLIILLP